ncbi:hypothetical protein ACFVWR_13480 [Leifsonia sp. NPDC058292]|uniref:hypothetical protein n=1 Tax=Leifsonia sp. NPDC058292 TaxID=3346428 RepID=UPI0036D926E7
MTLLLERSLTHLDPVAESFAFGPETKDVLPTFQTRCTVVRLGSLDNEVLGVPRWSTLAEIWTEPGSAVRQRWLDNPVVTVAADDGPGLVLATLMPVIVFGADNEAHDYARSVIDGVRASCASVLVVDMGHRLTGHTYADVATFGFDPARGAALLGLLTGLA